LKNRRVLSIDLGSAYSKIAVRREWNGESELLRDLPLAADDVDFCIPSVVARVGDGNGSGWMIGSAAGSLVPGDGVRIYRYWKARLFSTDPGARVTRDQMGQSSAEYDREESETVAIQFFRGIREMLERTPFADEVAAAAVRVCVPKIETTDMDGRVGGLLEAAGFRPAKGRATVYEPESNACGIFTRGRNQTWYPPAVSFMPRSGRSMHLRKMLEPEGLLQALRRMTGTFGVLVIDIGGFTTDFGYLEFDTSFQSDDWQRPRIVQQSYELGIRELDQAIYESLGDQAQQAIRGLSAAEWEAIKGDIYAGMEVVLDGEGGRPVRIGRGADAEKIREALARFAERVIEVRDAFTREFVGGAPINGQTLTGGGSMIAAVRNAVLQALDSEEGVRMYDLLDEQEPLRTLRGRASPAGYVDEREVRARARRNLELVRGGSAIGGSSVFFE
jgi:hypothetical protein